MFAVEIKNLNFSYVPEKPILKNINLSIPYNKYVCIVGHNGSGKSTLSKLLSGLVQANSGTIHICNILMNQENIAKITNKIGLIFQNPDNQFIGITPEDDIAFGLENRKIPPSIIKVIIDKVAGFLNIKDILYTNATFLSGGQKQKVAIASVLATNPEVIIFDESTSMLDGDNKKEIIKIILDLVKKEKKTVISITHDMEELLLADEIIILKNGEKVLHSSDKSILQDWDFLSSCNLTPPFIYFLQQKLKKNGVDIPFFEDEEDFLQKLSSF